VHRVIRSWLKDSAPTVAPFVILYGGSVNLKNAAELSQSPNWMACWSAERRSIPVAGRSLCAPP